MKSEIEYDYAKNTHTHLGAHAALSLLFQNSKPNSLLDVGTGIGYWIKAALEHGVAEAYGIEGTEIPDDFLQVDRSLLHTHDLNLPWDLHRRFDAILCLEVAEHLSEDSAKCLIECLTKHSDRIYFSAACPGQKGQHHINCQWPDYWQRLFNERGFSCSDQIRWDLWDVNGIEPWYRQNLFMASSDLQGAGRERRISPVIHPEMVALIGNKELEEENRKTRQRYESMIRSRSWKVTKPLRLLDGFLAPRYFQWVGRGLKGGTSSWSFPALR